MYGRVLVPLDGSATAAAVLPFVRAIPCRSVRLLQVVRPRSPTAGVRHATEALRAVAADLGAGGRHVDAVVVRGDPADQIVAAAADADLIAMTTCGEGAGGQLIFGSVADRVARHAPVPTLLVRAGDDPVAPSSITRIVVPLDGSPIAVRAVAVATRLGDAVAGRLLLVSIAELPDDAIQRTGSDRVPVDSDHTGIDARQRRAAHLREVAAATGAPDAIETFVGSGNPADEILRVIAPGDLIVMTTHGGGGGQRWRIGGVAAHLLRHAPAPVLLVRGDRHGADA